MTGPSVPRVIVHTTQELLTRRDRLRHDLKTLRDLPTEDELLTLIDEARFLLGNDADRCAGELGYSCYLPDSHGGSHDSNPPARPDTGTRP